MIRLMASAVGASELIARPVAHGRLRGLSRLTAPTHGAWFWAALWAAAAAAGFAVLRPALLGHGPALPAHEVIHRLSGVSFAACGLVAWRRRPDSGVGRLLTLAGFGILVPPVVGQIDTPFTQTLALLFDELWIAAFAALILTFVTGGRLTTRVDAALVGTFVFGLLVLQFAVMLFLPPEGNLLSVSPDAGIANALFKVQFSLLSAASLAVVVVIWAPWRAASRPLRRALLPSLGGSLCGVLYSASIVTILAGSPVLALLTLLNTALLTVPAALLWGLLRSRLARGGLADLFRELSTLRGVRLEEGLARVLGDPGLVLAYRVPGERSYVDGRGLPAELPAPGGERVAAPVDRNGRELALLIYDASLDEDPELVGAVAAAAAITLDDARLQSESQDRLAELRASR